MRKYSLASGKARMAVDLRDYTATIEEAVHEAISTATVEVYETYYTVSPTPSKGQAIKIGRKICQSALAKYCVAMPKLFTSVEVSDREKEKTEDGTDQQERIGGHM